MNTLLFNLLAYATPGDASETARTVKPETLLFPENAATDTSVDSLFYFIFWVSAFFLVLNAGLMIYFAIRYRQRNKEGAAHGHTHNTAMEITWSVIPAFILAIIFIWGFRGFLQMANPPNIDPQHEILVTGKQWDWAFMYPNGEYVKGAGSAKPVLHVPSGVPVRLTMRSEDVLHSLFIPAFRVKKDVVPGRVTQLWFEPIYDPDNNTIAVDVPIPGDENKMITLHPNVYDLYCTEYCGQAHSLMVTKVYVYSPEDYAMWYASMSIIDPNTPLVELGANLYLQKCLTCHSLDGSANTGPTWLDLYGNMRNTSDGQRLADNAYIIESIRNPSAVLASRTDGSNYANGMSPFGELSDREVMAIIEYMKSISEHAVADPDLTYGDLNPNGSLKEEGDGSGDGAGDETGDETGEEPADE